MELRSILKGQRLGGRPVRSLMGGGVVQGVVDFKLQEAFAVLQSDAIARSVALRARSDPKGVVIRGGPTRQHVRSWCRREGSAQQHEWKARAKRLRDPVTFVPRRKPRRAPKDDGEDRRPAQFKRHWTPEALLKAIRYSSDLRDQDNFIRSLRRCEQYMDERRGSSVPEGMRVDDFDHPSGRTNRRSLMKLDAVGCLIQRRQVAAIIGDGTLRSVHLFADGSPVTGLEIQAMLIDMAFTSGTVERTILPAVLLGYSLTTALDKTLALLWALWLCVGPAMEIMRTVLDSVISFTTDQGTEATMLDVPDILPAFMQWIRGTPIRDLRPFIDYGRKLMPRAIRIPGWGHLCAGLMKYVCKFSSRWPVYLDYMRHLVRMMRNSTWREHLAKTFPGKPYACHLQKTFVANFLKWRYQTLHDVAQALLQLRDFV